MAIAIDPQRLAKIVETLLPRRRLQPSEASTMLQFVQLAAGVDWIEAPIEHHIVQTLAQTVCGLAGLRAGEVLAIPPVEDDLARIARLQRLGRQLASREVRELTYAFVFLASVADVQLTAQEREALEDFQHALGIDHDRATDLVILLTEVVAAPEATA